MAKKLTPAEQRAQERKAQLKQRHIQRMQERNARMEAQREARHQERLKQVWVDALKDALKKKEDVSVYATTIKQHGYDFDNCLEIAIQQCEEELKQEFEANKKKSFLKMLKNIITENPQLKVDNLNFAKIQEEWEYTEEDVRRMFHKTVKNMFEAVYEKECELDEPCEENLKALYTLGVHLGKTEQSINKDIADYRKKRAERAAAQERQDRKNDFVDEHKNIAWITIAILSILEIIFIKWWSILAIPATFLVIPLYNFIAELVFDFKNKQ